MIEKITALNITQELIENGTKFEQVSEIAQQPYFITGMIVIFGIMVLLWFISGFFRIAKNSNKLCWGSWVHKIPIILILIGIGLYIIIFILPIPTIWI